MAECECVGGCVFFNDKMTNMPQLAESMKKKYCMGDNTQCARFMVFQKLGKPMVPADLFPNQMEKAKSVIATG